MKKEGREKKRRNGREKGGKGREKEGRDEERREGMRKGKEEAMMMVIMVWESSVVRRKLMSFVCLKRIGSIRG